MSTHTTPEWFAPLVEAATASDGVRPFSDQTLVEVADGRRSILAEGADAAAVVRPETAYEPAELELVVHPEQRRQGLGGALLSRVVEQHPRLLAWAHGDLPGSRELAASAGFVPVRTLLQLRAPVPDETTPDAEFTAFRPGTDDAAWLDLNARAFADHPEQGSLVQADLDARMAEDWFNPDDFLLLWDGDRLAAFTWMKIVDGIGEFYVVGVDPDQQGRGLGRRLVAAGLARLAERGIRTASLYVDGENTAAVRLYRSYGFGDHTIDVQYRREG